MFTGIIESCVPVRAFEPLGEGAALVLPLPSEGSAPWSVETGQSIAICGVCLTVADRRPVSPGESEAPHDLVFHLSRETLERTWFGQLEAGRMVNLERALCLGDRLDGHMVSGHVDGAGRVTAIQDVGDGGRVITFEVDPGLERYLVDKGSISLDGVSLTVVRPKGRQFDVALIPLTLELTNLGAAEVGTAVNVEADMIGKWIERLGRTDG
jgi:riboflavin synthase